MLINVLVTYQRVLSELNWALTWGIFLILRAQKCYDCFDSVSRQRLAGLSCSWLFHFINCPEDGRKRECCFCKSGWVIRWGDKKRLHFGKISEDEIDIRSHWSPMYNLSFLSQKQHLIQYSMFFLKWKSKTWSFKWRHVAWVPCIQKYEEDNSPRSPMDGKRKY